MRRSHGLSTWLLAVAALFAGAAGCNRSDLPRFDAVPGPISAADLATAAADESRPVDADEWAAIDAVHDRYLADFDALRAETLAPLVREARAAAQHQVERDAAELARFGRRHASAVARIRALDDRFIADLAGAIRDREAFAERTGMRRTIARAACIVQGLGDGDGRAATFLDLEPAVRGLRLDAALHAAAEPALAAYRRELARGAEELATAMIAFPARLLEERTSAGVDDQRLEELRTHAGEGDEQRSAFDRASEDRERADREAKRPRARAMLLIDQANARLVAALAAVLPPETLARIEDLDRRRRTSEDRICEIVRMVLGVYRLHPDVRSGKAPRTAKLVDEGTAVFDEMLRLGIATARARLEAAVAGAPAPDDDADGKLRAVRDRAIAVGERLREAIKEEIQDGTYQFLERVDLNTPNEVRERLAPLIGDAGADRVVRSSARTLFRDERRTPDPAWQESLSIAEQLLLAPGMDHAAFRRAARAIGARDDDALVEQIWERHQARVDALLVRQREQMRTLEARSMQAAQNAGADPLAFERSLGEYLQALLAADGERRDADDETFRDIAVAADVAPDDARFVLARTVSAARRASLPLRRFRQPWLLGPAWEADADPIAAAIDLEDEVQRAAALAVMAAHAERLRAAADDARQAGLGALRDFLLFGVRAQREGRQGPPESFADLPEVRAIAARVDAAGKARRRAQREAIASVATIDPALAERFMQSWVHATFPEFFVGARAWHAAAALAAAPPEAAGDAADARLRQSVARWIDADLAIAHRLAAWQDARRETPAPANGADAVVAAACDPALGALASMRDEAAFRLLRDASVAQGLPPDARMHDDERCGALERPVTWLP